MSSHTNVYQRILMQVTTHKPVAPYVLYTAHAACSVTLAQLQIHNNSKNRTCKKVTKTRITHRQMLHTCSQPSHTALHSSLYYTFIA